MEYTQLTIADWLEMKAKLKEELIAASASFVRIGYMLRKIQDGELYKADGYKSVTEFAEKECGLNASAVSRFMAINKKYSIDGYSDRLQAEYARLGQSKLAEMLTLPDRDMELIRPETERSQIRDLKNFNRSGPEGQVINVNQLIEAFFKDCREELNEIYKPGGIYDLRKIKDLAELLNPSGNRVYRKGMFMLFFYTDILKIKKFGSDPTSMEWEEFFERMAEIFRDDKAAADVWAAHYGEEVPDEEEPGKETGEAEEADEGAAADKGTQGADREDPGPGQGDGEHDQGRHDVSAAERRADRTAEEGPGKPAEEDPVTPPEKIAPAQKSEETAEILNAEEVSTDPESPVETIYYPGSVVLLKVKITNVQQSPDGISYEAKLETGEDIWLRTEDIYRSYFGKG